MEYVDIYTAKVLKSIGFNAMTETYYKETNFLMTKEDYKLIVLDNKLQCNYNHQSYSGLYLRPTISQAMDWLLKRS
jgi:hypothetical protein